MVNQCVNQPFPALLFQNHRFCCALSCLARPKNSSASSANLCDRLAKLEIFSPRSSARLVVSDSWSMTLVTPGGLAREDAAAAAAGGGGGLDLAAAGCRPRLRSSRSPSSSLGQLERQERKVLTSRENKPPNIPGLELWLGVLVSSSSCTERGLCKRK